MSCLFSVFAALMTGRKVALTLQDGLQGRPSCLAVPAGALSGLTGLHPDPKL